MTVLDIVNEYLKQHGYDGLCHPETDCGCRISDLAPCCDCIAQCRPGYLQHKDGEWGIYIKEAE